MALFLLLLPPFDHFLDFLFDHWQVLFINATGRVSLYDTVIDQRFLYNFWMMTKEKWNWWCQNGANVCFVARSRSSIMTTLFIQLILLLLKLYHTIVLQFVQTFTVDFKDKSVNWRMRRLDDECDCINIKIYPANKTQCWWQRETILNIGWNSRTFWKIVREHLFCQWLWLKIASELLCISLGCVWDAPRVVNLNQTFERKHGLFFFYAQLSHQHLKTRFGHSSLQIKMHRLDAVCVSVKLTLPLKSTISSPVE